MTDIAQPVPTAMQHTSDEAKVRLRRRYAAERRFKLYGIAAVMVSAVFLVLLLGTIIRDGLPAFTTHSLTLELDLKAEDIDPDGNRAPEVLARANYNAVVREALLTRFPGVSGRRERRSLSQIVSAGGPYQVQRAVVADPALVGGRLVIDLPVSDDVDLYLKGDLMDKVAHPVKGIASPTGTEGTIRVLSTANDFAPELALVKESLGEFAARQRRNAAAKSRSEAQLATLLAAVEQQAGGADSERAARLRRELEGVRAEIARFRERAEGLEARASAPGDPEALSDDLPSFLISINGGVVKANLIGNAEIEGEVLVPLQSTEDAPKEDWSIIELPRPEGERKITDRQIAWIDQLNEDGAIASHFNAFFFEAGASREAELAGIWGAVVGSFFTMVVTLLLSFPLGVAAAIYLEEFAPKNRWTQLIEVNINNLAAVPSIVFGLLGLAVFLNFFGLPRSAPLVGGMVLALMTLPTIIIASRAALRAVPPSIREGALGIGASKIQSVFHHVLPLAMPGILTGTIIGMAQALGETAPLLMIGMVAFIVDIPGGFTDPSTVLPVQIYMWSDFPERAFTQKTAAAIMVLLGFLIAMNALAVVLRKRFERRW